MAVPLFALSLDINGVGTVLPSLEVDLGIGVDSVGWVVNATALTMAALLIPVGRIAPRLGNRTLVMVGVALFGTASIVCGVADNLPVLLLGRTLQGIGGVLTFTTSLAVITAAFDESRRATAVGAWGVVNGVAGSLGPIVGGAATSWVSWRAFFWLNVPLCLLAVPVIRALAPADERADHIGPVPWGKLVLLGVAAVTGTVGLQSSADLGWTSPLTIGGLVVGAVTACALLVLRGRGEAVVSATVRAGRLFRASGVVAFTGNWGFGVSIVFLGLYLQRVGGLSPVDAGLVFCIFSATSALAGTTVGPLTRRLGVVGAVRLTMVVAAAGLGLAALLGSDTSLVLVGVVLAVGGFGQGLVFDLSTVASIDGMPDTETNEASAVVSVVRSLGLTIGVAVSSTVQASFGDDGLLGGIRAVLVLAAVMALFGLLPLARVRAGSPAYPGPDAAP